MAEIIGIRTRKPSLWEEEHLMVFCATASMATKNLQAHRNTAIKKRTWHPRNRGELLLGVGWDDLETWTMWACLCHTKQGTIPFADLFAVEFPFAYAWTADKWQMDLARVYPARIEMPTCDKAHRVAILDLAAENNYRSGTSSREWAFELLVERACSCFCDRKTPHEGSLFVYRWR